MTSQSKIPHSADRRNIALTLDILGEFHKRPDNPHYDHSISGLLAWLGERQTAAIAVERRSDNIPQLSECYTSALTACQSAGADKKIVLWILDNTGMAIALCERILEMRTAEIDNYVLENLVDAVY
jgi:hypothetical protein